MSSSLRPLTLWLAGVCLTIFVMVVVGGITRLTESGLSMVDWRPVIGIIPPVGEEAWNRVFEDYKSFPQYQKVNSEMSLEDFKYIFYWEYGHRVLGRLIGLLYFVPFVVFLAVGKVPSNLKPKLLVGLVLGGLQGLMGWYMVKSGLVDEPRVSHFRLAAHLMLALLIFAYLVWLILDLVEWPKIEVSRFFRVLAMVFAGLLVLQILYGAFVAGIRAGYGFNTFPLMNGEWLPGVARQLEPLADNFLNNAAMIQFVHRWLGALVLLTAGLLVWRALSTGQSRLKWLAALLMLVVTLQFLLGVFTLILVVPISLASIHQAGACIVLLVTVMLLHSLKAPGVNESLSRTD